MTISLVKRCWWSTNYSLLVQLVCLEVPHLCRDLKVLYLDFFCIYRWNPYIWIQRYTQKYFRFNDLGSLPAWREADLFSKYANQSTILYTHHRLLKKIASSQEAVFVFWSREIRRFAGHKFLKWKSTAKHNVQFGWMRAIPARSRSSMNGIFLSNLW